MGTTRELKLYEVDGVPFRLIDTVGFEPSFIKERLVINAVKKWSKESAKNGNEDTGINIIWFCVDGTAAKLFPKTITNLSKATSMWEAILVTLNDTAFAPPERISELIDITNEIMPEGVQCTC